MFSSVCKNLKAHDKRYVVHDGKTPIHQPRINQKNRIQLINTIAQGLKHYILQLAPSQAVKTFWLRAKKSLTTKMDFFENISLDGL